MTTPAVRKVLKPFQEALLFQRKRSPMVADNFYSLIPEARPRAFTITGLQRYSSLLEANRLVEEALASGMTKSDFADHLGEIVDAQGGTILSPQRLELIHQNAIATATAAGRYQQLSDPDVLDERPYWQYPLGPHDGRTSAICRQLEGLVARHDDPIWDHIYPPNHHNERHYNVTSLTAEQAGESGKLYEHGEKNPKLGPVIDGREILPDPGFDFAPKNVMAADDRFFAKALADLGPEIPMKTAADYGLASLDTLPPDSPPRLGSPFRGDRAADWNAFREATGIGEGATGAWFVDYASDGVRVNEDTFLHLAGYASSGEQLSPAARAERGIVLPLIQHVLENPAEVWYVRRNRPDGAPYYIKRYLGIYTIEDKKKIVAIYFERSAEGWLRLRTIYRSSPESPSDWKGIERRERNGLLVFSRAGRKE
ncbi:MAG: phage minor head protein [Thermoanaerobaculia bacterium]